MRNDPVEHERNPILWVEPETIAAATPPVHVNRLINELLLGRGLATRADVAAFFDSAPQQSPDPFALPGMGAAVDRIEGAVRQGERIAIFGDYDVDGITATAILLLALRSATRDSGNVLSRLPHRMEGYGLSRTAIEEIASYGASLLIAVDCASTDTEHVAFAQEQGLDVVILDHHQMDDAGPPGAIVVSAYQSPGLPYRELSAAGLAWLLCNALFQRGLDTGNPLQLQDLAALGGLADMSPVTGVHRALLRDGLERLRRNPRPGLQALARHAKIELAAIDSQNLVFKITPRLNAAGRLGDPQIALDLVLARDPITAEGLAAEIERLNQQRKLVSAEIVDEAIRAVESNEFWHDQAGLVVSKPGWLPGVLGIAASQLTQRFGRPVILLSEENGTAKGSARSVAGVDVMAAIDECRSWIQRSGGHTQAAGLAMDTANVEAFRQAFHEAVLRQGAVLDEEPAYLFDAVLHAEDFNLQTALLLEKFHPHGNGNPRPFLLVRGLIPKEAKHVNAKADHLRFEFDTPYGKGKGICFGAGSRLEELSNARTVEFAASLGVERWNGREQANLEIVDFRVIP